MKMSKNQLLLHTKATALNKIRKICHPKYNGFSQWPEDGSYGEQRSEMIIEIIEELEKNLIKIKKKFNQNHDRKTYKF